MNARKRLERELTLVLAEIRRLDGAPSTLVDRAELLHEALDRVDDGSYGLCVECGEAVPSDRLRAVPEAEACTGCEQRREQPALSRNRVA
jgi:hypothetical protein